MTTKGNYEKRHYCIRLDLLLYFQYCTFAHNSKYFKFQSWDRTRYLENLSGEEVDCSMIARDSYAFPQALR